jgi:hypothetical protein
LITTTTTTNKEGKAMRERFNVVLWEKRMRQAIGDRNGDRLASLMEENDRNGVFSYADSIAEGWEQTRDEWVVSLIECAETMLSGVND